MIPLRFANDGWLTARHTPATTAGMIPPARHPHGSRSRPFNHENQRGPDLSFNLPNPNTLCNLSSQKSNGQHEPNRLASAVVTWMAPRPRPAKQFGSRRSQGAERRKAMETRPVC